MPSSSTARVTALPLIAVPLIGAALVALTGCAVLDSVGSHEREQVFPTAEVVDDAAFALPKWVPAVATDLRIRVEKDGPGALLRFTAATIDGCDAGRFDDDPPMDSSWFPSDHPEEGSLCGDWRVFERDGVVYGWTG